ncbi:hypothetical protein TREMEDRAFT_64128 [Tremella mesenterica DSM 1558]|uniref:uncharacterized protein n=1 Tax=Tremella mesenterica (strain ATCC 24925 / CBS 8224 / DSM 1558 / NBRC 9311 / NRRL Y-6157 / RJB 2259-6 / UBC 559-6) TaxID=578456 RepID=UPI0003F49EF8|nr:uncharacterized protein TREMEDRAFT_64128 [Tremella mesenterica DSM 1558]EIW67539.1 hypothetical protein TREMEDRAFT_64128 [Tremella mesenterica DSM 1558]
MKIPKRDAVDDNGQNDWFFNHKNLFYPILGGVLGFITLLCLYVLWRGPTRTLFPCFLSKSGKERKKKNKSSPSTDSKALPNLSTIPNGIKSGILTNSSSSTGIPIASRGIVADSTSSTNLNPSTTLHNLPSSSSPPITLTKELDTRLTSTTSSTLPDQKSRSNNSNNKPTLTIHTHSNPGTSQENVKKNDNGYLSELKYTTTTQRAESIHSSSSRKSKKLVKKSKKPKSILSPQTSDNPMKVHFQTNDPSSQTNSYFNNEDINIQGKRDSPASTITFKFPSPLPPGPHPHYSLSSPLSNQIPSYSYTTSSPSTRITPHTQLPISKTLNKSSGNQKEVQQQTRVLRRPTHVAHPSDVSHPSWSAGQPSWHSSAFSSSDQSWNSLNNSHYSNPPISGSMAYTWSVAQPQTGYTNFTSYSPTQYIPSPYPPNNGYPPQAPFVQTPNIVHPLTHGPAYGGQIDNSPNTPPRMTPPYASLERSNAGRVERSEVEMKQEVPITMPVPRPLTVGPGVGMRKGGEEMVLHMPIPRPPRGVSLFASSSTSLSNRVEHAL